MSVIISRIFLVCDLKPARACQTANLHLEGAQGWTPTMYIRLVQDFGLECEVAQHLSQSYGDRAFAVAKMAALTGKRWPIIGKKIHPEFPYIDAEVKKLKFQAIPAIPFTISFNFNNCTLQLGSLWLPRIRQISNRYDRQTSEIIILECTSCSRSSAHNLRYHGRRTKVERG